MKFLSMAFLICSLFATIANAAKVERNSNAQAAFDAGQEAYEKGEYQKAVYAFQHATRFDPSYYEAYCLLGLMYLLNDEIERGLNMLTYATQTFPQEGYAFALLGDFYQIQRNTDKAIEYYQKAIDLTLPKSEKIKYGKKLKNLTETKQEVLNSKTVAASAIVNRVSLGSTDEWSVAFAMDEPDYFEIAYQYGKEDLLSNDWTQKITLKCTHNQIGKRPFKELFADVSNGFIRQGIAIANVDPSFRSGSFTTSQGDNRSVVYLFTSGTDLCVAERMKKGRWLPNEPNVFLEQLKRIEISGGE